MNLLNDLMGNSDRSPKKDKPGSKKDNVYIQFDNDEALLLFKNIDVSDSVFFILDEENNEIIFECPQTGKKIKLYRK